MIAMNPSISIRQGGYPDVENEWFGPKTSVFASILSYHNIGQVLLCKIIPHLVPEIIYIHRFIQHRLLLPAQAVVIRYAPEFVLLIYVRHTADGHVMMILPRVHTSHHESSFPLIQTQHMFVPPDCLVGLIVFDHSMSQIPHRPHLKPRVVLKGYAPEFQWKGM